MSGFSWEAQAGITIPDGFVLERLIQATPNFALYKAHAASESQQPEALIELVIPQEEPQTVVNRFLEASYLRHRNLAGISSAGFLEQHGLVYALAEPVDHTLTDFIAQNPLPVDQAIDVVDSIAAALAFLHAENLVFCNLRPESVWQTASNWKLGDFSQLRVIGRGDSRELRATLARRPDLPPEVYEGVISPAWDVWSLGVLLRRILAPAAAQTDTAASAPRNRLRNSDLPAPFDTIARDCLHPDPDARITLDALRARLKGPRHGTAAEAAGVETKSLPSRFADYVRTVTHERPAWIAVACAIPILAIMVSANALLRHPDPPAKPIVVEGPAPPVVASEADRVSEPAKPAPTAVPEGVKNLLDKWVASTKARDVATNVACYAPVVDPYFGKQRLTRKQLVREKERQFRGSGTVRRYGVENVQFKQINATQAVVLFDKQWSLGDKKPSSGSERAQLTLRNIGGEWKISGERQLKVYWVRRGRA